ncbi:hypothetical protein TWF481_009990 [Arthrobotrys musiformis]|uniref:Uncharacterized protein n=1 Tax=Arthrobotrys musiformis TaxID=47236 RepID=A0AAV9W0T4_9PEZI
MTEFNSMSMSSGNTYNENCSHQTDILVGALPLLDDIELGSQVAIADYGCSQGNNSLTMMQHVLKRMAPSSIASLIFEDLPSNEFSSLIKLLPGVTAANPDLKIYPSLVPRSFYEPITTPGTVDIGFSSCTVHWLKRMTMPKPPNETVIEYYDKRGSRDSPAAREDFREFLTLRGEEIKSGGYLVMGILGSFTKEELSTGYQDSTSLRMRAIFRAAEVLANEGKIPLKAMEKINIPFYCRSEEEFRSGVEELKGTWVVETCERRMTVHPYYFNFLRFCENADQNEKIAASKELERSLVLWLLAVLGDMVKNSWLEAGLEADRVEGLYQELISIAADILWKEGVRRTEIPIIYSRLRRV